MEKEVSLFNSTLEEAVCSLSVLSAQSLYSTLSSIPVLRPSLMQEHTSTQSDPIRKLINSLRHHGPRSRSLAAPSSDEDSSEEGFASVQQVSESMIESQEPILTHPSLFLSNIDPRFSTYSLSNRLSELSEGLVRVDYTVFTPREDRKIDCAVVSFRTLEIAKKVYRKLVKENTANRLTRWLYRIPGSQHRIEVKWLFNSTRERHTEFHAVILRGLEEGMGMDKLARRLRTLSAKIEPIRKIRSSLCTVVILRSFDELYNLVKKFPQLNIKGKIDVHPYSSVFKSPEEVACKMVQGVLPLKRTRPNPDVGPTKREELGECEDEKPTSGEIHEEGEISDREGAVEDKDTESHTLYEFPGSYVCSNRELYSHSGQFIQTNYVRKDNTEGVSFSKLMKQPTQLLANQIKLYVGEGSVEFHIASLGEGCSVGDVIEALVTERIGEWGCIKYRPMEVQETRVLSTMENPLLLKSQGWGEWPKFYLPMEMS